MIRLFRERLQTLDLFVTNSTPTLLSARRFGLRVCNTFVRRYYVYFVSCYKFTQEPDTAGEISQYTLTSITRIGIRRVDRVNSWGEGTLGYYGERRSWLP